MLCWPVRPASFTHVPFSAISASSQYSEAAWELLRWICIDPQQRRAKLELVFQPPALKSVSEEYAAVVEAVVPGLRGKRLLAWQDPVFANEVYTGPDFLFASDQAYQIIVGVNDGMLSRRVGMQQAFAGRSPDQRTEVRRGLGVSPTSLAALRAARTKQRLRLSRMFSQVS